MYLPNGTYLRLQQAFNENGLSINVKSDYMVVENSEEQVEEKIIKIVESVGFSPLISNNKIDNKFAFTIPPFELPKFFNIISFDEISSLLEGSKFASKEEGGNIKDRWSLVNAFRSFVLPALNLGILEILSPHIKGEFAAVEIGSEIGYTLPSRIAKKIIRIQPSTAVCQLSTKRSTDPVYQLDIDGLYSRLIGSGKKVPLFFAIHVFDDISPDKRKTSFSQLSQLQNSGDRILMMLDANPLLGVTIKQLEALYPDHAIFPYFPLTKEPAKFSVLIVPIQYVQHKPSLSELCELIEVEAKAIMSGRASELQKGLHLLQSKFGLKVIVLEDFVTEQVSKELEEAGYKTKIYYHASFTTGDLPNALSGIKQDLIYKSVTDTASIRQWSLTDKNLLNCLSQKGIHLPEHFNELFLQDLRRKGKKIFGAEILVVEATKV